MTVARDHIAAEHTSAKDRLNRGIAQDARTDQELESQVPPISEGGTGWRIAIAVALILGLMAAVVLIN